MSSTEIVLRREVLRRKHELQKTERATDYGIEPASAAEELLHAEVEGGASKVVWLVSSLAAASLLAMWLVPVEVVVTAPGRVVSLEPTVIVQPLETSIVRAIEVEEGQTVRAGDLLARLDPTFTAADSSALQSQVDSFQAEISRLEAEASDRPYVPIRHTPTESVQAALHTSRISQYRFQLESYEQKIKALQASIAQAKGDVKAYQDRLKIALTLEDMYRELEARKVGNLVNLLGAKDRRLELERNVADSSNLAQKLSRDLEQVSADRDAFQHQWKAQIGQELALRHRALSDAREGLTKASMRRQLVELRSDQDAIVLTVAKVAVGSVVQSGDQILTLIPERAKLEIEARVNGADAGLLHNGRSAIIKFDAFPYMRFGTASGSVRSISADSFTNAAEEMQRGAGISRPQQVAPYYKTRIGIDKIELHGVPSGFRLRAGMPVTADINLGQRTVLDYLFAQVLATGSEGMREP